MLLDPQFTHCLVSCTEHCFGRRYSSEYEDDGGGERDEEERGEDEPEDGEYKFEEDKSSVDCVGLLQ